MNPAVIDTLKFADRLKNAGFPPPQAEGLARVLGDELGKRMVTKRDLDEAVQTINATIGILDAKFESKFEAMDQKFEAMDQRFEARFEAMDQRFEARFEAMDQKFEAMDQRFEARFEAMDQKFEVRFEAIDQKFEVRFEAIDQKFDSKFLSLEPRFDAIDAKLESQNRESSTRFNVLFGTMALGFTLVIGLIGYSLFSPRPAGSPSPAVEHGVADATWRTPALSELS